MSATTVEHTPLGIPTLPDVIFDAVPSLCEGCQEFPPHWWMVNEPCGCMFAVCHDCKREGEKQWAARLARGKRAGVCGTCRHMTVNIRWEPISE